METYHIAYTVMYLVVQCLVCNNENYLFCVCCFIEVCKSFNIIRFVCGKFHMCTHLETHHLKSDSGEVLKPKKRGALIQTYHIAHILLYLAT